MDEIKEKEFGKTWTTIKDLEPNHFYIHTDKIIFGNDIIEIDAQSLFGNDKVEKIIINVNGQNYVFNKEVK